MARVDVNTLLSMVERMEVVLDRYLTGPARSSETIAQVLDICRQIHATKLNAAARYWLEAIEHRVAQIGNARADDSDPSALSRRFVSTRLLEDIHNLRRSLLAVERAARDRRAPTAYSWLTRMRL